MTTANHGSRRFGVLTPSKQELTAASTPPDTPSSRTAAGTWTRASGTGDVHAGKCSVCTFYLAEVLEQRPESGPADGA
ncbi:hypothetical protein EYF80_066900 [Liparis tanakae]|uniref:Uncharacterized protein n=1 Tax=Liparis tanakae TaxID=230148 RepID=A0A4Z2E2M0_9TELE|nr:hypothetical protein EYF80_066900 [Liparis tanakae]